MMLTYVKLSAVMLYLCGMLLLKDVIGVSFVVTPNQQSGCRNYNMSLVGFDHNKVLQMFGFMRTAKITNSNG